VYEVADVPQRVYENLPAVIALMLLGCTVVQVGAVAVHELLISATTSVFPKGRTSSGLHARRGRHALRSQPLTPVQIVMLDTARRP
jgi:hypothetical protein